MRRLLPLLLASCAGIAPPSYTTLDRAPTQAEAHARPRPTTEPRQERWILLRGKTEIVFTLLVQFESDGVQFVALDDLGGVLADSDGRESRVLPKGIAERIGRLLRAKYAPRTTQLIQVESRTGWAESDAVWIEDELYVAGLRVRQLSPQRYEVEGALTATVTIG